MVPQVEIEDEVEDQKVKEEKKILTQNLKDVLMKQLKHAQIGSESKPEVQVLEEVGKDENGNQFLSEIGEYPDYPKAQVG